MANDTPNMLEALKRHLEAAENLERSARQSASEALRQADIAARTAKAFRLIIAQLTTASAPAPMTEPRIDATCAALHGAAVAAPEPEASATRAVVDMIDNLLAEHPEGVRPREAHEMVANRCGGTFPKHHVLNALARCHKEMGWVKSGTGWETRWFHATHAPREAEQNGSSTYAMQA